MHPITFLIPFYTPILALPQQPPPGPAPWSITDFTIDLYPDTSLAAFQFHDASPNNPIELSCVLDEQPIYRDKFTACGLDLDLLFKLSEGEVVLRRTLDGGMTGVASQGTYWDAGPDGNVTSTDNGGKVYRRVTEWYFPVQAIVG